MSNYEVTYVSQGYGEKTLETRAPSEQVAKENIRWYTGNQVTIIRVRNVGGR